MYVSISLCWRLRVFPGSELSNASSWTQMSCWAMQRWLLLMWFILFEWLQPQQRSPATSDRLQKRPLCIQRGWVSSSEDPAQTGEEDTQWKSLPGAAAPARSTDDCFMSTNGGRTKPPCALISKSCMNVWEHQWYLFSILFIRFLVLFVLFLPSPHLYIHHHHPWKCV